MYELGDSAEEVSVSLTRITPPPLSALETAAAAGAPRRCHREGEECPLYASEDPLTAEAEVNYSHAYLRGMEVRWTWLEGRLRLLDLSDPDVLRRLGTTFDEIASESWATCQAIAGQAFSDGIEALRLPSVRRTGHNNVVVARPAIARLEVIRIEYRILGP